MQFSRSDFPDDFLFGVATSSYQIEGHKHGGAGRTHWDDFAATPGNVVRAENGDLGCDHYNRLNEDLDIISALGVDSYRFSTSWARVMPEGRGAVNEAGLDFYERLVDGLLERGIKPAATLYHWEMPSALADLGGWRNRDIANWFGDFTEALMGRIGDRVWSVATINEPWCVGWLSHFMGVHAPGLRDIRATARAMHHVLLAHGTATQRMREMGITNLGAVCNFEWATPVDDSPEAKLAADRYDAIYNRFFLGGIFKGAYPDLVLEGLEPHLPHGWQDDFGTISTPVDWCGLNYYTRTLVGADPNSPWPHYSQHTGDLPLTSMGWEIYPQGLHDFLVRTATEYTGSLPLYVTENGMSAPDHIENGAVDDPHRIAYLEAHFAQAKAAIEKGVPLKGYYIWSLMDNFEWSLGYEKRFGLVHVDFDTFARTPKSSFEALAQALRRQTRL